MPTPTPGPGPDPKPPVETKDTKAPTINVSISSVNVFGGQEVTLGTSELKIGTETVATWTDDISKSCKVDLSLVPSGGQSKAINSGDVLSEEGKLRVKVSDEAGNSSEAEITLTAVMTYHAPNLTTADVIGEKYSWYNNLAEKNKEFIYPHILISYFSLQWGWLENLEYILACETTKYPEPYYENVAGQYALDEYVTGHADTGCERVRNLSPESTIKTC